METTTNRRGENSIKTTVSDDKRFVRLEMSVVGYEGCLWIDFDAEQFDNLLMNLHRARGEMR